MKTELSTVLIILTICSLVGAFLLFVLGRVLTDKKDKMTLAFEIKNLETKINALEQDASKIEPILRELEVIKEQIKHL